MAKIPSSKGFVKPKKETMTTAAIPIVPVPMRIGNTTVKRLPPGKSKDEK